MALTVQLGPRPSLDCLVEARMDVPNLSTPTNNPLTSLDRRVEASLDGWEGAVHAKIVNRSVRFSDFGPGGSSPRMLVRESFCVQMPRSKSARNSRCRQSHCGL